MSQQAILDWCKSQGIELRPADPAVIAEYERSMREETIPAIVRDIKVNARAVREARHVLLFATPPGGEGE